MTDEPDNPVLEHLELIRETTERMADYVRDIKIRMTSLEATVATLNNRVDRMEIRSERIERRLDLVET
jgi:predicted  nucleic acid-binding Zn-ribbon protein